MLLTCKTFHKAAGTTQVLVTNQLTFLPRETGEAFLEKRMALTSVVAGRAVHIPKSIALSSTVTLFILEVGLRAHRCSYDVCMCV